MEMTGNHMKKSKTRVKPIYGKPQSLDRGILIAKAKRSNQIKHLLI